MQQPKYSAKALSDCGDLFQLFLKPVYSPRTTFVRHFRIRPHHKANPHQKDAVLRARKTKPRNHPKPRKFSQIAISSLTEPDHLRRTVVPNAVYDEMRSLLPRRTGFCEQLPLAFWIASLIVDTLMALGTICRCCGEKIQARANANPNICLACAQLLED